MMAFWNEVWENGNEETKRKKKKKNKVCHFDHPNKAKYDAKCSIVISIQGHARHLGPLILDIFTSQPVVLLGSACATPFKEVGTWPDSTNVPSNRRSCSKARPSPCPFIFPSSSEEPISSHTLHHKAPFSFGCFARARRDCALHTADGLAMKKRTNRKGHQY